MDISNFAVTQIQEHGFSVLHSVFSTHEVDRLRVLLEHANSSHNRSLRIETDRDMVHNSHFISPKVLEAFEHPLIDSVLSTLIGKSYILYACQSSSLPPKGSNYARRIHVDSPRLIKNYLTNIGVIIALDDFSASTGAISFLPNSFKSQKPPTDSFFEKNSVQVVCPRGSILIFNARTFHREGVNSTDRYRHALTANFCRCFMRQRFDFIRMAEVNGLILSMTSNQRKLLGYNVRIPASLDEFFLPTDQRLYKSGQE